jgi:hypothetical protein
MNTHSKRARQRLRKHSRWWQQMRQLVFDPSVSRCMLPSCMGLEGKEGSCVFWRGRWWEETRSFLWDNFVECVKRGAK